MQKRSERFHLILLIVVCFQLLSTVCAGHSEAIRIDAHRPDLVLTHSTARGLLQSEEAQNEGDAAEASASLRGRASGQFNRVKHFIKLNDKSEHITYTCWTPQGITLKDRIVTIVTIMFGTNHAHEFVRSNRLSYVKKNNYRYCELNHRLDPTRIAAWYKLPLVMALLPCSDYVIHVDADALLVNHDNSFEPVVAYMKHHNVDLLLSADIIKESPINFGVFAVRPATWVYDLFLKLYNECACDWSRNFDWPAEQGTLYDLLVRDYNTPDVVNRTHIASMKQWNRHWMFWRHGDKMIMKKDLVVHFTGINEFGKDKSCGVNYTCRFNTIEKHYQVALQDKTVPAPVEFDETKDFRKSVCNQLYFKQLVRADYTYENRPHERHSSSFLDVQLTPRGTPRKVIIGEIACLGYRKSRCHVHKYWNTSSGHGPWMPKMAFPFKWYKDHVKASAANNQATPAIQQAGQA